VTSWYAGKKVHKKLMKLNKLDISSSIDLHSSIIYCSYNRSVLVPVAGFLSFWRQGVSWTEASCCNGQVLYVIWSYSSINSATNLQIEYTSTNHGNITHHSTKLHNSGFVILYITWYNALEANSISNSCLVKHIYQFDPWQPSLSQCPPVD